MFVGEQVMEQLCPGLVLVQYPGFVFLDDEIGPCHSAGVSGPDSGPCMVVGTFRSSKSEIFSGIVPSGRDTTTSSLSPFISANTHIPVPSASSRYSPISGSPSRTNLHIRDSILHPLLPLLFPSDRSTDIFGSLPYSHEAVFPCIRTASESSISSAPNVFCFL